MAQFGFKLCSDAEAEQAWQAHLGVSASLNAALQSSLNPLTAKAKHKLLTDSSPAVGTSSWRPAVPSQTLRVAPRADTPYMPKPYVAGPRVTCPTCLQDVDMYKLALHQVSCTRPRTIGWPINDWH